MSGLFTSKTNFTSGEIAHNLLGRVDLRAYENGAMSLKNVFIEPTGGVYRRPGLKQVCGLAETGRLINFDLGYRESYLIILHNRTAGVYLNGALVQTLETPWTADQIFSVCWCQNTDTLFLTHADVRPQVLSRIDGEFILANFEFSVENECILQPYHKFCADNVTLKASGLGGDVVLETSHDFFNESHVGKLLKIADGYALINAVTDAKKASATVKKQLIEDGADSTKLEPTRYFSAPAFDDAKGWPACVAFYQSRLVFGGSKSLPNNLWFSVSGELFNFELGSSYDGDAIDFSLLSDGSNKICALFAGRHLQVFTSNAEWMVSGDPLAPANIQLKRQTQVGSVALRYVPAIGIDGATIFASNNGREIREFLFADIEGVYQATDLSLLASHLIHRPVDLAYDKESKIAYIVMETGRMAAFTTFRSEDVQSFSEQMTDGNFLSVSVAGGAAYFIVERAGAFFLERLEKSVQTDAAVLLESETPQTMWTYDSALAGRTVKIVAEGVVMPDKIVGADGSVELDFAAKSVQIGLPYTHLIAPLPPAAGASNGVAPVSQARLVKAVFRIVDSFSLQVDTGNGLHQELNQPLTGCRVNGDASVTGDIVVRGLGWTRRPTQPLWQIGGNLPKFFKLVSVTQDLKIGG